MHRTSVPMLWRRFRNKYHLIGTYCEKCKTGFYPPREVCPECRRGGKIVEKKFSNYGEIVTYTVISAPPAGFEKGAPYALAIVKMDENGPNVLGQVVDCDFEKLGMGLRVETTFRKIYEDGKEGIVQYGLKFMPITHENL
ncbi:MAG: Zn-ribbon domain-containing OB-fold protein [Candidatus Aenigmarchaeota archaeon]|nr:Zn-ribbon domain-containing OB-fold protein [Candidatus Aenigmarchaeota archaeon]